MRTIVCSFLCHRSGFSARRSLWTLYACTIFRPRFHVDCDISYHNWSLLFDLNQSLWQTLREAMSPSPEKQKCLRIQKFLVLWACSLPDFVLPDGDVPKRQHATLDSTTGRATPNSHATNFQAQMSQALTTRKGAHVIDNRYVKNGSSVIPWNLRICSDSESNDMCGLYLCISVNLSPYTLASWAIWISDIVNFHVYNAFLLTNYCY